MQWWNDFVDWLFSDASNEVVTTVILPFLAILVSGLVAILIARSAIKRLLAQRDREYRTSAVATLVDAAEQASVWNSLTADEQVLADRSAGQADIQIRLLPLRGADVAANWAGHALREMKRRSATYGYQVAPAINEFRDRMVEWVKHPSRARKAFAQDLEQWSFEVDDSEKSLIAKQDEWVAQQHRKQHSAPATQAAPVAAATAAATAEPAVGSFGFDEPVTKAVPVAEPAAQSPVAETIVIEPAPAEPAVVEPAAPQQPVAQTPSQSETSAALQPGAVIPPYRGSVDAPGSSGPVSSYSAEGDDKA